MKSVFLKPLGLCICLMTCGLSWSITSDDIDGGVVSKNSSLEPFTVEIRGPGGKRIDADIAAPAKKQVIPNERLGLKPKPSVNSRPNQNTQAINKTAFSGFFEYKFPSSYNINENNGTVDLKSGETLWKLANSTKDPSVSVNQQIASIFRKNLACFPNGKLNIRSGCIITLPTVEQSKLESPALAKALIAHNGVSFEEYRYAMAYCSSGICGIKAVPKEVAQNTGKGTTAIDRNEKVSLSTETEDGGSGVIYYTDDGKKDQKQSIGKEIQVAESFVLLDDKGRELNLDQLNKQNNKTARNESEKKASGSSLTFSKDDGTVKAMNAKGEIISEVSQKYDGRLQDMDDRVSGTSNEVMAARSDIAELKQEITELKELLKQKEELQKQVSETQAAENEVSPMLISIIAVLIGAFILALIYMVVLKRRKYRKEMEEESADDELDEAGNYDHLMTLDPMSMSADPNSIDLNVPSDEPVASKQKDEFVVASDNSSNLSVDDLDEPSVQKVNIDNADETVKEDPSMRTSQKVDVQDSDDLVPQDLMKGSEEPLDESLFLDEDKDKAPENKENPTKDDADYAKETDDILQSMTSKNDTASIDLDGEDLDDKDIDNVISQTNTTTNDNAEVASDVDIDAIVNNVQESEPVAPSKVDEIASADDIDSLLDSVGSEVKNEPVDDIDALLNSVQNNEEKASSKNEKNLPADDIDSLLDSAGSNVKDEPVDDIDALLNSVQNNEEKDNVKKKDKLKKKENEKASSFDEDITSADDVDILLNSVQKNEEKENVKDKKKDKLKKKEKASSSDEKIPSVDDVDSLLDTVGSEVKNEDVDDIDALLNSVQNNDETKQETETEIASSMSDNVVSADDIDSLLDDAGSKAKDEPVDDIDALLNSVQNDEGKDAPKEEMIVSADDVDGMKVATDEQLQEAIRTQEEELTLASAYLGIDSKKEAITTLNGLIENAVTSDIKQKAEEMLKKIKK